MTIWEFIMMISTALPIVGIMMGGSDVITSADVRFWVEYLKSKSSTTGSSVSVSVSSHNPSRATMVTLEREAPPATGPIFASYDPEIQALLAFE